jgi:hypothetical protein
VRLLHAAAQAHLCHGCSTVWWRRVLLLSRWCDAAVGPTTSKWVVWKVPRVSLKSKIHVCAAQSRWCGNTPLLLLICVITAWM